MSRRALRSTTISSRINRDELAIPNTLPEDGTMSKIANKRCKREHEDAEFAQVRSTRGCTPVVVYELRDEWQRLLLPTRGSVHAEGRESVILAADAEVPDIRPLYVGACFCNEAAEQLLTRTLGTLIAEEDWQELWVTLGQISVCIEQLARPDAVRPWWVRQTQDAANSDVVMRLPPVDLVAREAPGGVDAPLDTETASEPAAKLEMEPVTSNTATAEAASERQVFYEQLSTLEEQVAEQDSIYDRLRGTFQPVSSVETLQDSLSEAMTLFKKFHDEAELDDGVPTADYAAAAERRRARGMPSVPPSLMRVRTFSCVKSATSSLAEALDKQGRLIEAQQFYDASVAHAVRSTEEIWQSPEQIVTALNNQALCYSRRCVDIDDALGMAPQAAKSYQNAIDLLIQTEGEAVRNSPREQNMLKAVHDLYDFMGKQVQQGRRTDVLMKMAEGISWLNNHERLAERDF